MLFHYPAVVMKDAGSSFGAVFPDLACYPVADTLDGVLAEAETALAGSIAVTLEEGLDLPEPTSIEDIDLSAYDNIVAVRMIAADVTTRARRINITLDEGLIAEIDRRARNRSGFIAEAVRKALG